MSAATMAADINFTCFVGLSTAIAFTCWLQHIHGSLQDTLQMPSL